MRREGKGGGAEVLLRSTFPPCCEAGCGDLLDGSTSQRGFRIDGCEEDEVRTTLLRYQKALFVVWSRRRDPSNSSGIGSLKHDDMDLLGANYGAPLLRGTDGTLAGEHLSWDE